MTSNPNYVWLLETREAFVAIAASRSYPCPRLSKASKPNQRTQFHSRGLSNRPNNEDCCRSPRPFRLCRRLCPFSSVPGASLLRAVPATKSTSFSAFRRLTPYFSLQASISLSAALDDMAGSTMPIKSFDPLGLASWGSDETFAWFQASELKHS